MGAGYAWDWFSFRFDDVGALMLYQFRDANDAVVMGCGIYIDNDRPVTYGTNFRVVT